LKQVLEKKMKVEDLSRVIEGAGSLLNDDGKPKRTGFFLNPKNFCCSFLDLH